MWLKCGCLCEGSTCTVTILKPPHLVITWYSIYNIAFIYIIVINRYFPVTVKSFNELKWMSNPGSFPVL